MSANQLAVREQPNGPLTPQASEPALPAVEVPRAMEQRYPDIGKALQAAQARCKSASKDATNTFHHYKYASAEAIITEAKAALESTGLSVLPHPAKMVVLGSGTQAIYGMRRAVILLHASGEWVSLDPIEWPVCPDRGRPLDKAFASAITTSLAYYLRDLLMMPRVDPADNMDHDSRDQHAEPEPVPQKPAKPQSAPPKAPPKQEKPTANALPADGKELLQRLQAYDAKLGAGGRLVARVVEEGVQQHDYPADLTQWNSEEQIGFAVDVAKTLDAAMFVAKNAPQEPREAAKPAEPARKPAEGQWGGAAHNPTAAPTTPKTGEEFRTWLLARDKTGAAEGHWEPAALVGHIGRLADIEGLPVDMDGWDAATVRAGLELVRQFESATVKLRPEQVEEVRTWLSRSKKEASAMLSWLDDETNVATGGKLDGLRQVHYARLVPMMKSKKAG